MTRRVASERSPLIHNSVVKAFFPFLLRSFNNQSNAVPRSTLFRQIISSVNHIEPIQYHIEHSKLCLLRTPSPAYSLPYQARSSMSVKDAFPAYSLPYQTRLTMSVKDAFPAYSLPYRVRSTMSVKNASPAYYHIEHS